MDDNENEQMARQDTALFDRIKTLESDEQLNLVLQLIRSNNFCSNNLQQLSQELRAQEAQLRVDQFRASSAALKSLDPTRIRVNSYSCQHIHRTDWGAGTYTGTFIEVKASYRITTATGSTENFTANALYFNLEIERDCTAWSAQLEAEYRGLLIRPYVESHYSTHRDFHGWDHETFDRDRGCAVNLKRLLIMVAMDLQLDPTDPVLEALMDIFWCSSVVDGWSEPSLKVVVMNEMSEDYYL